MIDKKEAAEILKRIAVLLELAGENPFKSRAYENAAGTVEKFEEDMDALLEKATAGQIKGIGKAIAENLVEMAENGRSLVLENLEAKFPEGLLELLKIQGLGPKKVKRLYEELDIKSLIELEYACLENRLSGLSGFGKKSQENILNGVSHLKKFKGRFHLHAAIKNGDEILNYLKQAGFADSIEICGSLRRGKETVKDIDLLAVAEDSASLMDAFVSAHFVDRVTGHGATKSSVILNSGMAVDLRVVTKNEFPATLAYFTGNADHNIHLRSMAKEKGLKLNEYGLFDGDRPLPLKTERDIYAKLGMAYIPPELREDDKEYEAALIGKLPVPVELSDIRGVLHCHTNFSDGTETVDAMAGACREKGYGYLGISDHSKTAVYAGGLTEDRIAQQGKRIAEWNAENPDFVVFAGIESDILSDGALDYDVAVLKTLDFVIASIHSGFTGTLEETTRRIITAIENPFTRILGHPTGRLLLGRDGYRVDMDKVIDACAANHVVIELNANPHRLDIDWRLIRRALQKGVKIAVNPDAHSIPQIDFISLGVMMAKKGWCEKSDVINCMSANEFAAFLKEGK